MGRWGETSSVGEITREEGSIERRGEGSGKSQKHPKLGGQRVEVNGHWVTRRCTNVMGASGRGSFTDTMLHVIGRIQCDCLKMFCTSFFFTSFMHVYLMF